MNEVDEALQGVFAADLIQAKKNDARAAYEERVVKDIMMKAGLDFKPLLTLMRERTGKPRLTLPAFYEAFGTFPIWLTAKKLPYVFQVTFKDVFNKFCSTPMFKAWEEWNEECVNEGKPVGLVFDWPGVSGTKMIIHDDTLPPDETANGVRLQRLIGNPLSPNAFIITIEQFAPYLERTVRRWVQPMIDDGGTVPQNT